MGMYVNLKLSFIKETTDTLMSLIPDVAKALKMLECFLFFNCYLAAPWPTLGHSQRDSLTNSLFITEFLLFQPEGHWDSCNRLVHKYEAAFGCNVDVLMAVTFLSIVLFQKQNKKMI